MDPIQKTNEPTIGVYPKVKLTAREFFLWSGIIISLYVSVSSLLDIIFTTLNKAFPDALYGDFSYQASGIGLLSVQISIVIVLLPVFTVLTYFVNKELAKNPERANLGFRKFAIYLTLFLSTALVVTDLIVLVHYFLNGEITTRFIIKVLVVLGVAAVVGSYYIFDLRRDVAKKTKLIQMYGALAWIIMIAAIVCAFSVLGSPKTQRALTFDMQRVQSLQEVERSVANYWQDHGKMPASNADLKNYYLPMDPEAGAGKSLEYLSGTGMTFQVCATFSAASENIPTLTRPYGDTSFLPKDVTGDPWIHAKGYTCFARVLDPEQFPVRENLTK